MTLIIGGTGQGKLNYVMHHFPVTEQDVGDTLGEWQVIYPLQEIIRTLLAQNIDPLTALSEHCSTHPEVIYICDEVGSGVVPLEPEQRDWREAVGRCCVMLAARANRVERIFCGLSMVLKDE